MASNDTTDDKDKRKSLAVSTVDYHVFSPPVQTDNVMFSHVVIIGDSSALAKAFNWSSAGYFIDFYESQKCNVKGFWKKLSHHATKVPDNALWIFLGDIDLVADVIKGNSKDSIGTSIKCPQLENCAVTEVKIKCKIDDNDKISGEEFDLFVDDNLTKFQNNLNKFVDKLSPNADILLCSATPHVILKMLITKTGHSIHHKDLKFYPDILFTRDSPSHWASVAEKFSQRWKKMAVEMACSQKVITVLEKCLVYPEVDTNMVAHRKVLNKLYKDRKCWFINMWNIINMSLGNTDEVITDPSSDYNPTSWLPNLRTPSELQQSSAGAEDLTSAADSDMELQQSTTVAADPTSAADSDIKLQQSSAGAADARSTADSDIKLQQSSAGAADARSTSDSDLDSTSIKVEDDDATGCTDMNKDASQVDALEKVNAKMDVEENDASAAATHSGVDTNNDLMDGVGVERNEDAVMDSSITVNQDEDDQLDFDEDEYDEMDQTNDESQHPQQVSSTTVALSPEMKTSFLVRSIGHTKQAYSSYFFSKVLVNIVETMGGSSDCVKYVHFKEDSLTSGIQGDARDVVIVGDERVAKYNTCSFLPATVHHEEKCTFSRAIELSHEKIDQYTKVLVIYAYHYDFIYESENMFCVKTDSPVPSMLKEMVQAIPLWKKKNPNLSIIFIEPYCVDIFKYNAERFPCPSPKHIARCNFFSKCYAKYCEQLRSIETFSSKITLFKIQSRYNINGNDGFHIHQSYSTKYWSELYSFVSELVERQINTSGNGIDEPNPDKVLMVGDERLMKVTSKFGENFVSHHEDHCTISRAIELADKHLTDSTLMLVIAALHYDIVEEKASHSLVRPESVLPEIVDKVEKAVLSWKTLYPKLIITFILPHGMDFAEYNLTKLLKSSNPSREEKKMMATSHSFAAIYDSRIDELKVHLRKLSLHMYEISTSTKEKLAYIDGFSLTEESNEIYFKSFEPDMQDLMKQSADEERNALTEQLTTESLERMNDAVGEECYQVTLPAVPGVLLSRLLAGYNFIDRQLVVHHLNDLPRCEFSECHLLSFKSLLDEEVQSSYTEPTIDELLKRLDKIIDPMTYKLHPCKDSKCRDTHKCHQYHERPGVNDKRNDPLTCYSKGFMQCSNDCHLEPFCQSCLIPSLYLKKMCKKKPLSCDWTCKMAHPGSPDMFYHQSWINLYVRGIDEVYFYVAAAIRNLYKILCGSRAFPYVLVLTGSNRRARHIREVIDPIIKRYNLHVSSSSPLKANVVVTTVSGFVSGMIYKGSLNTMQTVRSIILTDPTALLRQHKSIFNNFVQIMNDASNLKRGSRVNKVVIAAEINNDEIAQMKKIFETDFYVVGRAKQYT